MTHNKARDPRRDGPRTFRPDRQRRLAREVRRRPDQTADELARRLDYAGGGSVKDALELLVAYRVLEAAEEVGNGGRRKRVYRFRDAWGDALDDALRAAPPDPPRDGQRAIVVNRSGLPVLVRVLRRGDIRDAVDWVVELDDMAHGAVLILAEHVSLTRTNRILAELGEAGLDARSIRIGSIWSDVGRWTTAMG